jgi:PAS domain S-box-containing protein
MSIFPFLHFFGFVAYCYLAVYILIKNPAALVNRITTAVFLCFAVWSFSFVFFHAPGTSKQAAALFTNISAIGWISFSSFYFWFMLAYTGKTAIFNKKWFFPVLFGIPLLFIYKQWTGFIFVDYVWQWYGWRGIYGSTLWPYLFFFYYICLVCLGLILNFVFIKRTDSPVLKKQASIIFVAMLIALVLGSFTDVVFILAGIAVIPNIADFFVLAWAVGVVYAMVKYKFLSITPITAADNIIATMFDSLILLDVEGYIVAVNCAASNLSGYSEEELKGEPVDILLGDSTDGREAFFENLVLKEAVKTGDFVLRTKDGEDIPVLFSSSLLKDENGTAVGIVCVAKDISERKRLEKETLKSKKLESVGILAAGIAHDFNNLLAVIIGNIVLARQELTPDNTPYRLLVNAEEASERAAALASRFITFSHGGWLNRQKISIPQLIKNLDPLRFTAENSVNGTANEVVQSKHISFEMDLEANLMPVYGDRLQLLQVLKNLLFNAVESIPKDRDGQVIVRGRNFTVDENTGKNGILLLKKGKYVELSVQDNGSGVPPENADAVFDPYFSTKSATSKQGLGLGLTICYSIVKKHGGHISMDSEPGKGTTVTFYLPALDS